ncbi:MAG: helix-turn-helix domain-containing protein [Myxococcota bacterium]
MSAEELSRTISAAQLRATDSARCLLVVRQGQCQEVPLPAHGTCVLGRGHQADIVVDDRSLSRHHLEFRVGPTLQVKELGSRNGTRLRGRPLPPGAPVDLLDGDVLEAGRCSIIVRDGPEDSARAKPDGEWMAARVASTRLARTELNVLFQGEAGTGKRSLAVDLHEASESTDALDIVDGATLHADLLGAMRHRQAPLLLLHAEAVPSELQGAVFKALEGSSRRVLATARTDLSLLVAQTRFYVRLHRLLARAVIRVPALRDCGSEFEDVVLTIVRRRATQMQLPGPPHLSPRAMHVLRQRPWPGNVAALATCLDATLAGLTGHEIHPRDLVFPGETVQVGSDADIERQRIIDALDRCAGNQTQAAKLLKISRRTLINRLDKYGIARPRKR